MQINKEEITAIAAANQNQPSMFQRFVSFWDQFVNGRKPKSHDIEIMFGPQAAGRIEHGRIVGTWVKEGHPRPITISFSIKSHDALPPRLDMHILAEIYDQATFSGIVMTHISAYAALTPVRTHQGPTRNPKLVNETAQTPE